VLFTTPLPCIIRKHFPDARIDMLVNKKTADIYLNNPNINSFIMIDRAEYSRNTYKYFDLLRQIRQNRYDITINLHGMEKTTALNALSGADVRCGIAARGLFRHFFTNLTWLNPRGHIVDAFLKILDGLDIYEYENPGLEMAVDDNSRKTVEDLWRAHGLEPSRKVIGLNPGASVSCKQWPHFSKLIETLVKKKYLPVVFGGKTDHQTIERLLGETAVRPVNLAGQLNLLQLAAAIKKCDVFVSNDTGPMHIAAAQKRPIVALFGPTSPERYGPYGTPNIILSGGPFSGASASPNCATYDCMAGIAVENVVAAIDELLPAY